MQTKNRIFDELAKVMTNAAGAMKGFRDEAETMMRAQIERLVNQLDLVPREEFDAVKALAQKARAEADRLEKRVAALEGKKTRVKKATRAAS